VARGACDLPLLRKDFIIDPYQLHEAVQAGADAVLLIVAALTEEELQLLHGCARSLGLDVLVEVHDAAELDRALAAGLRSWDQQRDLRDFSVDLSRTESLARRIPSTVAVVSESGIHAPSSWRACRISAWRACSWGGADARARPAGALRALRSFRNAEERFRWRSLPVVILASHEEDIPAAAHLRLIGGGVVVAVVAAAGGLGESQHTVTTVESATPVGPPRQHRHAVERVDRAPDLCARRARVAFVTSTVVQKRNPLRPVRRR